MLPLLSWLFIFLLFSILAPIAHNLPRAIPYTVLFFLNYENVKRFLWLYRYLDKIFKIRNSAKCKLICIFTIQIKEPFHTQPWFSKELKANVNLIIEKQFIFLLKSIQNMARETTFKGIEQYVLCWGFTYLTLRAQAYTFTTLKKSCSGLIMFLRVQIILERTKLSFIYLFNKDLLSIY